MSLRCLEVGALLTARRSGLSEVQRLRLEHHLEGCSSCRFDARTLDELAGALEPGTIEGVADRALGRALATDLPEAARPRPARSLAVPVGAAAIALAAIATLVIWSARPTEEPSAARLTRTPKESGRFVTGDDGAQIHVAQADVGARPGAALAWEGAEIMLERGTLHIEVDPQAHRPFRVECENFAVEVTGTLFDVSPERVQVHRGSVRIRAVGGAVLVAELGAGQTWVFDPPGETHRPTAALEPSAAPESETRTSVASVSRARRRRRRRPVSQPHDVPAAPVTPGDPAAASNEVAPSARQRFEEAIRLQRTDPNAAIAIYRELEVERGPWAANALFAHGRFALERGERARARSLFVRYLDRYPTGSNAADARALLSRASP